MAIAETPGTAQGGEVVVDVRTDGHVPEGSDRYLRRRLEPLMAHAVGPVRFIRVRLAMSADPAHDHPASARGEMDVDGHVFHAHAEAPTMTEAIDHLHDRLDTQLRHDKSRRQAERHRGVEG